MRVSNVYGRLENNTVLIHGKTHTGVESNDIVLLAAPYSIQDGICTFKIPEKVLAGLIQQLNKMATGQ